MEPRRRTNEPSMIEVLVLALLLGTVACLATMALDYLMEAT